MCHWRWVGLFFLTVTRGYGRSKLCGFILLIPTLTEVFAGVCFVMVWSMAGELFSFGVPSPTLLFGALTAGNFFFFSTLQNYYLRLVACLG